MEGPEGLRQSTLGILRDDTNTPRLLETLPMANGAKLKLNGAGGTGTDSDYYDYISSSSTATEKPSNSAESSRCGGYP